MTVTYSGGHKLYQGSPRFSTPDLTYFCSLFCRSGKPARAVSCLSALLLAPCAHTVFPSRPHPLSLLLINLPLFFKATSRSFSKPAQNDLAHLRMLTVFTVKQPNCNAMEFESSLQVWFSKNSGYPITKTKSNLLKTISQFKTNKKFPE